MKEGTRRSSIPTLSSLSRWENWLKGGSHWLPPPPEPGGPRMWLTVYGMLAHIPQLHLSCKYLTFGSPVWPHLPLSFYCTFPWRWYLLSLPSFPLSFDGGNTCPPCPCSQSTASPVLLFMYVAVPGLSHGTQDGCLLQQAGSCSCSMLTLFLTEHYHVEKLNANW